MNQNESTSNVETEKQTVVPWFSFLSKPFMNFRKPKIALPHKAPHKYVTALLFFFSVFLLAGGVYDLAEAPLALGYTDRGYTPIYPSLNDQFLVESMSTMIFIAVGAAGFFLLKFPTLKERETDMRSASFILSIGALLIVIGVIATYSMLQMKLYGRL